MKAGTYICKAQQNCHNCGALLFVELTSLKDESRQKLEQRVFVEFLAYVKAHKNSPACPRKIRIKVSSGRKCSRCDEKFELEDEFYYTRQTREEIQKEEGILGRTLLETERNHNEYCRREHTQSRVVIIEKNASKNRY